MLQELIKLKQIEPLDKAVSEIVGDGTLPLAFTLNAILLSTGWIQVGSIWEYTYINSAINEHSIAHVIPVNADLEVTRPAVLLPANSSYNGGVKIYALNQATADIHVVINVFGDGVEPTPPVDVPTKLSQLEKDIDFDERYYVESEINGFLDNKENSFAKNTAFNKDYGTTADTVCQGNDSRLSDARTPLAHNQAETTIDFTDITTGNASVTKHGFLPKLPNDSAKYLDGTGEFTTPPSSGGETVNIEALTANKTLTATSATIQILTCTAIRTVTLPTTGLTLGQRFEIWNNNVHNSTYHLIIYPSIDMVYAQRRATYRWDGATWSYDNRHNVANGYGANGSASGVANGYNANGYNGGVANGRQSNGSGSGVANGYNANGSDYGTANGYGANGSGSGVANGYNANGSNNGVANGNSANGSDNGVANGTNSTTNAKGLNTVAEGAYSKAERNREFVSTASVNNKAQLTIQKFVEKQLVTSGGAFQELFIDGTSARLTIIASSVYHFKAQINAIDVTNFNIKTWEVTGTIKRNGSNVTSIVGTPTKTIISADTATTNWDVQFTANDTAEALKIEVKHDSANNVRFSLNIFATETRV